MGYFKGFASPFRRLREDESKLCTEMRERMVKESVIPFFILVKISKICLPWIQAKEPNHVSINVLSSGLYKYTVFWFVLE